MTESQSEGEGFLTSARVSDQAEATPRLKGMLEPCVLLLLKRGSAHGYTLSEQIGHLSSCMREVSPSVVYRCLHNLEDEGLVEACWGSSLEGPSRRTYSLTAAGEQRLRDWARQMHRLRAEIDQFIAIFDGLMGE